MTSPYSIQLADRLSKVRISEGLTQIKMAKMLGVKTMTYSNWERGSRGTPIWMAGRLRDLFQINENWFLQGAGPKKTIDKSNDNTVWQNMMLDRLIKMEENIELILKKIDKPS